MSYHILSIDAYTCRLSCERGQLRCDDGINPSRTIPLEDVGAIVLSSFKATLTSNLLIEMAKNRIGFVLCESHQPAALLLPADRATDTALLRHLAVMPAQLRRRLWEKTLDAKCGNQAVLAQTWNPDHPGIPDLKKFSESRKSSREAECARLFWSVFSDTWSNSSFRRGRKEEGFNALFNYAYAVLLSCVLQYLFALGLDPCFGIFHQSREHAAPLAYDLMEPFRPAFDANVARWISLGVQEGKTEEQTGEVTGEYRRHIVATLQASVPYNNKQVSLRTAVESVCRSFRKAVLAQQSGPYEPWNMSTIKWAGS